MSYIVASQVREFVASKGLRMSGEFIEAADAGLVQSLESACERATENGRKTVQPCDL